MPPHTRQHSQAKQDLEFYFIQRKYKEIKGCLFGGIRGQWSTSPSRGFSPRAERSRKSKGKQKEGKCMLYMVFTNYLASIRMGRKIYSPNPFLMCNILSINKNNFTFFCMMSPSRLAVLRCVYLVIIGYTMK